MRTGSNLGEVRIPADYLFGNNLFSQYPDAPIVKIIQSLAAHRPPTLSKMDRKEAMQNATFDVEPQGPSGGTSVTPMWGDIPGRSRGLLRAGTKSEPGAKGITKNNLLVGIL